MTTQSSATLVQEFLKDHQRMTRLLAKLHEALGYGERQAVLELAREVDLAAGAHIEFEEQVLYPLVGEVRDLVFARQLYDEHQIVRQALEQLSTTTPEQLDPATMAELQSKLKAGLKHAESCGTLVSHLDALSAEEQALALARLKELRRVGRRWTKLPPRGVTGKKVNGNNG